MPDRGVFMNQVAFDVVISADLLTELSAEEAERRVRAYMKDCMETLKAGMGGEWKMQEPAPAPTVEL